MSIYKGNRIIAGTYPLYGTTGESNDGAMTQKATTDALNEAVSNITAYPKVYSAYGHIANAANGTFSGYGAAEVVLHSGGIAEVHFDYQVLAAGTISDLWNWGLNRDLLCAANSAIPTIAPLAGGTLQYVRDNGTLDVDLMGLGGTNTVPSTGVFWEPARVYQSVGSVGGYPENVAYQYLHLSGIYYGTYTVGSEG
jgi:hypothetical protein